MAKIEDEQNNLETKLERLEDYIREHTNSITTQLTQIKGEMPSTTVINPKCLKSLTLRSGKELEGPKDPRLE